MGHLKLYKELLHICYDLSSSHQQLNLEAQELEQPLLPLYAAVHIELVSDLTTEAFIGALKRFTSRRSHCKDLYYDNATNFVGAQNQLVGLTDSIYSVAAISAISKECSSKGITFHFIPPRAPHFGGLWEAAHLPVDNAEAVEGSDQEEFEMNQGNHPESRYMSVNIVTSLITLMLLPAVLGAQVQNMEFGTQLGIHFEGIGQHQFPLRIENFIYYDLKEFWTELEMFATGTRALGKLCEDMEEKATYKTLVKYFEYAKNELPTLG
ncbi:hypothetical protein EVAR_71733_1 [Eumeta japonica]|uniref:Uncharacterized protein n=1 Tax=Eumeta variegata TaxID=151549 RepID=A0A4C1SXX0_EUMVA|nr:hypothetical protein EVAR_71733_1 [Eumeta japonica]